MFVEGGGRVCKVGIIINRARFKDRGGGVGEIKNSSDLGGNLMRVVGGVDGDVYVDVIGIPNGSLVIGSHY